MKKHLFSLLVALVATAGSLPMAAQEAYAVLTEADSTLTFYYDNLRSTRPGTKYDIPTEKDTDPGWTGDIFTHQEKIKHAVFDASFADYRPTSTNRWFRYCVKLQDIKDIRNLNTEKVTDMGGMYNGGMFHGCSSLASLDLTSFNTANVTDMYGMFATCSSLTSLNLSSFNTENVINMGFMFFGCSSLTSLDLTNFNTANVTDMGAMFDLCSSLASLDLTNFNTEKVIDMYGMFSGCNSLTTIYCNDDWSVGGKVVIYSDMFSNCPNLKGAGAVFDSSKTGIEMANPTTGYFTAKTTGIDPVTVAGKVGDGKIYDLNGRQVSKNYKGVVVTNGRKILQR